MKVKLTFRSEDVRALDSFIRDVVTAAQKAGGKVCGPVPLPTRMTDTSPKANSYLGSLVKGKKIGLHLRALTIEGFEAGALGGAALDVFSAEPLPAESRLWHTRNLLITPHVAGGLTVPYTLRRNVEMFAENLRRYAAGKPLLHVVDRTRGY